MMHVISIALQIVGGIVLLGVVGILALLFLTPSGNPFE